MYDVVHATHIMYARRCCVAPHGAGEREQAQDESTEGLFVLSKVGLSAWLVYLRQDSPLGKGLPGGVANTHSVNGD